MSDEANEPLDKPKRTRAAQGTRRPGRKRTQQANAASPPAQKAAAPLATPTPAGRTAPQSPPVVEASAQPAPNETPVGVSWGEFPPKERRAELAQRIQVWDQESDHRNRPGPFAHSKLNGADVYWLAAFALGEGDVIGGTTHLKEPLVSLSNLHLEGANLAHAHLESANLSHTHLEGAILVDAQLEGASLIGAQLEGTDLREVHLKGANLSYAQLKGALILWAQLEGTDLSHAHLEEANLHNTRLEGAILVGHAANEAPFTSAAPDPPSRRNRARTRRCCRLPFHTKAVGFKFQPATDWVRTRRVAALAGCTFPHPPRRTRRASFPAPWLSVIRSLNG